jgi:hypothetical protein
MKTFVISAILFLAFISTPAHADGNGSFPVNAIRTYSTGSVQVWFSGSFETGTTCKYTSSDPAAYAFFDSNTAGGKSLLSLLTSAKLAGKSVFIGWTTSGCVLNYAQINCRLARNLVG